MTHHRHNRPRPSYAGGITTLSPTRQKRVDRLARALADLSLTGPEQQRAIALHRAGQRIYDQQRAEDRYLAAAALDRRRARLEAAITGAPADDHVAARWITGELRRVAQLLAAHDRVLRTLAELEEEGPMTTTMPTPPDVAAVLARVRDRFCDCPAHGLPDDQHSPDGCHGLEVVAFVAPLFADARAQSERIEALAGEWLQYARVAADLGHPPPMMTWASAAQRLLAALTPDTEPDHG